MLNNRPKAIFYCGANGSGKSTLRQFNQDRVSLVIDSDHIAAEINPEMPRLADMEAGKTALRLFRQALDNQISFSMESTLSGKSALPFADESFIFDNSSVYPQLQIWINQHQYLKNKHLVDWVQPIEQTILSNGLIFDSFLPHA